MQLLNLTLIIFRINMLFLQMLTIALNTQMQYVKLMNFNLF